MLFFFTRIEVVHRTTDTDEIRHLLKVQADGAHLHGALLRNLLDDLLLRECPLRLEDRLDDIGNRTRFVAPLAERVETATDEHELRIADELVVNCLNGDVLMIEACFSDLVCDLHEVERMSDLLEDDLDFVTDGARTDEAPLGETPAFCDFLEALVDRETARDQFLGRKTTLEGWHRLNRADEFRSLHAGMALVEEFHAHVDDRRNVVE